MARLNWENVANPNFNGVADSYRTMSDLLGKATASGQGILDTYKGAQQENADRAILQRIAGIQDMSQFDPNAVIGADGSKASLRTLGIVADRPDDLIKRAASLGQESRAQDTHGFNMKGNQRTMDSWLRTDAAAPVAQQIHQLRLQGKTAEADALLKDPRVAGLNISEYLNVAAMDGVAAGVESGRYNQNRSRAEDAFNDTAPQDWALLDAAGFGVDPTQDEIVAREVAQAQGWDPRRTQRALASRGVASGASGGGASGAIAAAVGSSPVGSSGFAFDVPQQKVAQVLKGGGATEAGIAGILGNFHAEGGYGSGQGDGGTASGIAQWREGRRDAFKAKYGVDPHKATHEQQAEFVLWEMTTPEGRKVSGISKENADKILNASDPKVAAELFDKYYERSSGEHRSRRVSAAVDAYKHIGGTSTPTDMNNVTNAPNYLTPGVTQEQAAQRLAADRMNNMITRATNPVEGGLQNFAQDRDVNQITRDNTIGTLIPWYEEQAKDGKLTAADAAGSLAEKYGVGDVGTITRRINEIRAESKKRGGREISIAEATAAIDVSLDSGTKGADFWGIRDWWGNTLGGDGFGANELSIDRTKLNELVDSVLSGTAEAQINQNEGLTRRQGRVNESLAVVSQVQQQLDNALRARATRGGTGMDKMITRLEAQLLHAASQAAGAQGNLQEELELLREAKRKEAEAVTEKERAAIDTRERLMFTGPGKAPIRL